MFNYTVFFENYFKQLENDFGDEGKALLAEFKLAILSLIALETDGSTPEDSFKNMLTAWTSPPDSNSFDDYLNGREEQLVSSQSNAKKLDGITKHMFAVAKVLYNTDSYYNSKFPSRGKNSKRKLRAKVAKKVADLLTTITKGLADSDLMAQYAVKKGPATSVVATSMFGRMGKNRGGSKQLSIEPADP